MSVLYQRVLLWHKLLAINTGGLALCSAKHRLNRDEARGWIDTSRNVADDIEQFLLDGTFILDDRGQRIVKSAGDDGNRRAPDVAPHPHTGAFLGKAVSRKAGGLRVATRRK